MSDFDSIDIIEEKLNTNKVNALCGKILENLDKLWCISLRKCEIEDEDFRKLLKNCRKCKNLTYLNLNVNIVSSIERVEMLASCLSNLTNLNTINLYSSNLGDNGLKILYDSMSSLKNLVSIDLGDCKLTDNSIDFINSFIYIDDKNNSGVEELGLSANDLITPTGWYQILLAIAASSNLKSLSADYTTIDDSCGYLIVTIIAASTTLETIDLEHTRLTDTSAKLFCYLIENYPVSLKSLNLIDNNIKTVLIDKIEKMLTVNSSRSSSIDYFEVNGENLKTDEFFKNAKDLFQDQKQFKSSLKKSNKKINESEIKLHKNLKNSFFIENENEDDFLQPIDDLRFKNHSVLPFNLMN